MPYGVSFAAAAIASSPTEFLGVMRSGSIEALFIFGFVGGFGCRPGTGLRRRGMVWIDFEKVVCADIRYNSFGQTNVAVLMNKIARDP